MVSTFNQQSGWIGIGAICSGHFRFLILTVGLKMKRDELYELFKAKAWKKGWRVDFECLPEGVGERFFPHRENIFKALELISPKQVKYLILGQDPYPSETDGEPDAIGIAFAVCGGRSENLPASLKRIMSHIYPNGEGRPDLESWRSKNQILLLNAALTVRPYEPGSHIEHWSTFTKCIIRQVRLASPEVKLIAWGTEARDILCNAISEITWSYHPVARMGGPNGFSEFWDTPVGVNLSA